MEMIENDVCLGETPMAGEIRFWALFCPTQNDGKSRTVCAPAKMSALSVLYAAMQHLGYPEHVAAVLFGRDPYRPEGEQLLNIEAMGWLPRGKVEIV